MRYGVLLMALAGVFAWQHRLDIRDWISPPAPVVLPAGVDVVLYATEWCGYCARTRRLLEDQQVPYREIDIEKSAEGYAQFQQLNGNGVPVLVIDEQVIHGFDRAAIDTALRRYRDTRPTLPAAATN